MACAAAEDLWALEDAIRAKADWWRKYGPHAPGWEVAEAFRQLVAGDDSDG
jgi:hypothetical protein